ncbi:hypothetical protein N7466_007701 [Penicillium verhagenii]|uniref:uncharacterized protein n=1 Tax=Penicillium verhagenii TaxID=1562060 RepID=UPI0025451D38|nr:uncharacterized protein N7466_007701 [Penicillium verhagenii]KAJ5928745.1 hypothetical protein N7466_007701 [Penicillium verhagenii]
MSPGTRSGSPAADAGPLSARKRAAPRAASGKRKATESTATANPKKIKAEPGSKRAEPKEKQPEREPEVELKGFDHSYVGESKPPAPPTMPARNERWQHKGAESLDDITKLPQGWNESEPDLHPDDLDAKIERCKERIEDNIMVKRFKRKLESLLEEKADNEAITASEPAGLSWPTIQRLQVLKITHANLTKDNDPYVMLPNVNGIMAAYRSGDLAWNTGLVTYWCDGKKLCEPRPLKWEDFEKAREAFPGPDHSFWIEGVRTNCPFTFKILKANDTPDA